MPVTIIVLILIVPLTESYLSLTWNAWYFRNGIPIWTSSVPVRGTDGALPDEDELAERMYSFWGQSLVFRSLSTHEMAFREKAMEFSFFRLTPMMHGYMEYVPRERAVIVLGLANWFALWFPVFFGGVGFLTLRSCWGGLGPVLVLMLIALVLGSNYAVQASRYRKVFDVLERHYSLKAEGYPFKTGQ